MPLETKNKASNEQFAERLRQLRMQKGISQKDFAHQIDLNYPQYNRYEKGETLPSAETLTKLADALNVTVDYLLEGKSEDAATARFEDTDLLRLFERLEKLSPADKNSIKDVIDGFLMKKELHKQLVG